MANTHTTLSSLFTAIANKIRAKTGSTASIVADNFPDAIDGIVTVSEGTADATATASDMANGVTAYVNGKKVTGNVTTYQNNSTLTYASQTPIAYSNGQIGAIITVSGNGVLCKNGSRIFTSFSKSSFGDATAADVAAGKTFTSSAGLKVTGTFSRNREDMEGSAYRYNSTHICVTFPSDAIGKYIDGYVSIYDSTKEAWFTIMFDRFNTDTYTSTNITSSNSLKIQVGDEVHTGFDVEIAEGTTTTIMINTTGTFSTSYFGNSKGVIYYSSY